MKTSISKTLWAIHNLVWLLAGTTSAATRLEIQMVPMLKLTGDVGSTNQIQYVTDLSQTNNWLTLTNIVLSNGPSYFVDTSGLPRRYYQAVLLTSVPTNFPANPDPEHLVWIKPGTFLMGSPPTENDRYSDENQHLVMLTKGFWMAKSEVTQRQYLTVLGTTPSYFTGDLDRPVDSVRWDDAVAYCDQLTQQEQSAGRLPAGYAYRLPTEAEWEYACRAGTTTRFSHGDDLSYTQLGQHAWFWENSWSATKPTGGYQKLSDDSGSDEDRYYTTHPVMTKKPNPWGLFDMYGNVLEWCLDRYSSSLPGGKVTDPKGPTSGSNRVLRGGSLSSQGSGCRSASRGYTSDSGWNTSIGFRPVLAHVQ